LLAYAAAQASITSTVGDCWTMKRLSWDRVRRLAQQRDLPDWRWIFEKQTLRDQLL